MSQICKASSAVSTTVSLDVDGNVYEHTPRDKSHTIILFHLATQHAKKVSDRKTSFSREFSALPDVDSDPLGCLYVSVVCKSPLVRCKSKTRSVDAEDCRSVGDNTATSDDDGETAVISDDDILVR